MIANGDKLVVTKNTSFLNRGDVIRVTDVNEEAGIFSFTFEEAPNRNGAMSISMCEEHFEKVIEKAEEIVPSITSEIIDEIMENSEFEVYTAFDKCTVVACKLPNGFVIIESFACVSPENYDEEMGTSICLEKIRDKVWELEGYMLQEELYRESIENSDCPCEFGSECDGCPYNCCEENEESEIK